MSKTDLPDFDQLEIETRRLERKSRRRFWLIIASVFLLPIVAMLWLYYGESRRLWLIELNKLKQEGIPYDTLSMQKYYESLTVPSLEVQRVLEVAKEIKYIDRETKFDSIPVHDYDALYWDQPWPEPELTEEFLSIVEPLLLQFRSVTTFDKPYRFPFSWSDGMLYGLDDLRLIRRSLFGKHAYYLSKGDLEVCLQCEEDIEAMLPMVRNQPGFSLLSEQQRFKLMHLKCVARRVEVGLGVTKDDLDMRRNDEIWNELKAQMELSLPEEFYLFLQTCNERRISIQYQDTRIPFFVTSDIDRRLGVLKLREFQGIVRSTSWKNGWKAARTWYDDVSQMTSHEGVFSKYQCPWYLNEFPSGTWLMPNALETLQQIHLHNAAIGIRIYYDLNGRWPESLESLSEIGIERDWIEPASDAPFGYRIEKAGALLWGYKFDPRELSPLPPEDLSLESENTEGYVYRIRAR